MREKLIIFPISCKIAVHSSSGADSHLLKKSASIRVDINYLKIKKVIMENPGHSSISCNKS